MALLPQKKMTYKRGCCWKICHK